MSTRREHAGLLLVDKPAGISSHDVVGVVRRAVRHRRVGHAGTLDPFATGLLVVAVGKATRLLPYLHGEPKVYEATIAFGNETDTDDATGTLTVSKPSPPFDVLREPQSAVRRAAEQQLTGTIAQVPPAYSAKYVDGQRAYDLARRGREVTLQPVSVVVHQWEWLGASPSELTVRITCGGGTYIRALARDLGRLLGSAAHCRALRRIASGVAQVERAVPLAALGPGSVADGLIGMQSPLSYLEPMAVESLDEAQLTALRFGRRIRATQPGARAAFVCDQEIVAIAERSADDHWQPRIVLIEPVS